MSAKTRDRLVTLGRISGVYGVKGWVKVHSYTEPRDNIVDFGSWIVTGARRRAPWKSRTGAAQGADVVAKLRGVDDREDAARADRRRNRRRAQATAGVRARRVLLDGPRRTRGSYAGAATRLGTVDHLLATGGHDVLVSDRRAAAADPVRAGRGDSGVDLDAGMIVADWPTDD